ncbi:tannase and feruloyl esterase [Fistulina hepatica ATCC 64428]|uniref:Carboxylic ester hydrolase n=1 Tax=Fistulina hepatica ATCC 64428 TaxID=1128425 RepID=A0A0D7AGT8_9AGAR|nr:tannase and feruloyl esterase [Fistulina hepatica ATCC 64428]
MLENILTPDDSVIHSDVCRIGWNVSTSDRSHFLMEAWFPRSHLLRPVHRFAATGSYMLNGCIDYAMLDHMSFLGLATVATNNGHAGMRGFAFLHNPNVVRDYADRALHSAIDAGKQLFRAFYGKLFFKSYYVDCSTGGRQGFMSAQRYPGDFDDIVAGSPALPFANLIARIAQFLIKTGKYTDVSFVPIETWRTLVHDEIMRQGDLLDGAEDGILENPSACQFMPETLICADGQTKDCLSPEQVRYILGIFTPLYGADGSELFPRITPGADFARDFEFVVSGTAIFISTDWMRYVVKNDSAWDPSTFTLDDAMEMIHQDPFGVSTWVGDLSPFEACGGKILHNHGMEDPLISPENSKRYYAHVSRTMNRPPASLDSFYRFFSISGLGHCFGGSGAYDIGNRQGSVSYETRSNVISAITNWVEDQQPPEVLRGTNVTVDREASWWRAHCRWPKQNRYVGNRYVPPLSPQDKDAWTCE